MQEPLLHTCRKPSPYPQNPCERLGVAMLPVTECSVGQRQEHPWRLLATSLSPGSLCKDLRWEVTN